MAVCKDCAWNPETGVFVFEHHEKCIERNKGKDIIDCDCQHRRPRTDSVTTPGATVLHPAGSIGPTGGGDSNSNQLAAGSGASPERSETQQQAVAHSEDLIGSLPEGEVR